MEHNRKIELETREKCKREVVDLIVKRMQEEGKGQLTAMYIIGLLNEITHDIEKKALSQGVQKII